MDGLPEETASVLRGLIARSEAHREEQIQRVHDLTARGQSTAEARRVLHQIEDTLQPCAAGERTCACWRAIRDEIRGDRRTAMIGIIDDLELTEQHIAEEAGRCARQAPLIAQLHAAGRDSAQAEEVLAQHEQTLEILRTHQRRLLAVQTGP